MSSKIIILHNTQDSKLYGEDVCGRKIYLLDYFITTNKYDDNGNLTFFATTLLKITT